ncbi:hypothetical protein HK405_002377 [Cladochytrium tenue]|nr:hypothetical protein HK405_002377 [Cladochytrium tenue]
MHCRPTFCVLVTTVHFITAAYMPTVVNARRNTITGAVAAIDTTTALATAATTAGPAMSTTATSATATASVAAKAFGYTAANAEVADPAHWADFYPACGGMQQSPINIAASGGCTSGAAPLNLAGDCTNYTLTKTEEAYKVAVVGGTCIAQTATAAYNLVGFHIHSLSEHKVDGLQYDAETHFVHNRTDGGALLVVGLYLQASDDPGVVTDPFLATVLNGMDTLAGAAQPLSLTLSKLTGGTVFNYAGSLTTPPCSEIVDWWVVRAPMLVARADLDRLYQHALEFAIYDNGRNARPTQQLNGRTVSIFNA